VLQQIDPEWQKKAVEHLNNLGYPDTGTMEINISVLRRPSVVPRELSTPLHSPLRDTLAKRLRDRLHAVAFLDGPAAAVRASAYYPLVKGPFAGAGRAHANAI